MQVGKQLGEVLLEQGLVTKDDLTKASEEETRSGKSAWKVLVERGVVTERDLVRARAVQIGLDFIDLRDHPIPPEATSLVPEETARRQLLIPVSTGKGSVVVAMAEPRNHLAVDEVASRTGMKVTPAAAYREDLMKAIERAYGEGAPVATATDTLPPPPPGEVGALGPTDVLVEAEPEALPAEAIEDDKDPSLAEFLYAVVEGEGSDLHLTAGLPPMIRVFGELRPLKGYRRLLPKDLQDIIYSMLTQRQREHFEENLELDVSYSLPGVARFRVNVFQQRDSVGSVMRLIPYEIKDVKSLGLPETVAEFASMRRGLVLVTGVTGSGKSTTLAALIDYVNATRSEHIMTVEDPIEFLHKHKKSVVNQREVGTDTHGFAQALKHVLRQDPDVILVGEMRDLETIQTALTAAETGHLVFATLHTQDAPQSVDRIIDVFPPHQQEQVRLQLAGSLAGIVSQQLVKSASGKGRVVAAEVLVAIPTVQNLIREGKTHQIYTSMQSGGKYGMQVMDQALAELVRRGQITYEMGLERCHRVEEYNRLAGRG